MFSLTRWILPWTLDLPPPAPPEKKPGLVSSMTMTEMFYTAMELLYTTVELVKRSVQHDGGKIIHYNATMEKKKVSHNDGKLNSFLLKREYRNIRKSSLTVSVSGVIRYTQVVIFRPELTNEMCDYYLPSTMEKIYDVYFLVQMCCKTSIDF